jgi:hypothetical protein
MTQEFLPANSNETKGAKVNHGSGGQPASQKTNTSPGLCLKGDPIMGASSIKKDRREGDEAKQ